jgi:hypothetical protein
VRNVLLLLVVLILCLAGGEVLLRAAGRPPWHPRASVGFGDEGWATFDPVLGWVNKPGTARSTEAGHVPMHFWPDGERASGPDPDREAAHTVWVVGGSFTAGMAVRDDQTFAWHLNEDFPDVRFENFAVAGYGTVQSELTMQRLLRERAAPPDLVLYGFIGDHGRRNVVSYKWLRSLVTSRGMYLVPPHVTLDGDHLVDHPFEVIEPWPLESHSSWITLLHDVRLRLRFFHRGDQKVEATDLVLQRWDAEARAAHTGLLVVLLNNVPAETPTFLAAHHIRTVDCVNPAYGHDPRLQVGGRGHPSAVQHALWADCIRSELETRGLGGPAGAP